jgi:5-methylcytosine-specific restriction endonuclease McrA
MPKLPDKKNRPWIPKRKKKVDILNINRSRAASDMIGFYNSKPWRSLRAYKIQINPLCENCEKKGLTEPGREVDHIIAIKDGGNRLGLHNLQTLCRSCHASKSAKEREARKHIKKYY